MGLLGKKPTPNNAVQEPEKKKKKEREREKYTRVLMWISRSKFFEKSSDTPIMIENSEAKQKIVDSGLAKICCY